MQQKIHGQIKYSYNSCTHPVKLHAPDKSYPLRRSRIPRDFPSYFLNIELLWMGLPKNGEEGCHYPVNAPYF
jgi:CO dehydrogenase nickel-insertion accessory protein CooC1